MANANAPLVSILTPSLNQAAYIGDALRSVACQSYPRIEHIVVDGGSIDGTQALLEAADPPVRWCSEPDRGQCHALNKAFAIAEGEIIGWVNSDDAYFDCDVVARVVECFAEYPWVDAVYGHAVRTDADGRIVWILWTPRFSYRLMQRMNFIVQPTVFMRRSALPDFLVDESFGFTMDWELWLRLGASHRFKRLNRVLAIDRYHPARRNKTDHDVYVRDEQRLVPLYKGGLPPLLPWSVYHRFYWVRQRLAGGLYVRAVAHTPLAFAGGIESERALWDRQVLVPKSKWTQKDQEAW